MKIYAFNLIMRKIFILILERKDLLCPILERKDLPYPIAERKDFLPYLNAERKDFLLYPILERKDPYPVVEKMGHNLISPVSGKSCSHLCLIEERKVQQLYLILG